MTVPIVVNSPNTSIELVIPVGRSNGPNVDALAITDVGALPDFAPRFTTLPDFTIADGDTAVGTIGAADVDEDTTDADDTVGPVTFGLTASGTDNPKFAIDPNSGALSLIAPAVHATQSSYSVEVSATDDAGGVTLQTVTVTVEAPPVPVTVTLTPITFDENAAGATIAEIAITGPDAPYGIGDVTLSDSTNFRVIDDNGALKLALAESVSLDNEAASLPGRHPDRGQRRVRRLHPRSRTTSTRRRRWTARWRPPASPRTAAPFRSRPWSPPTPTRHIRRSESVSRAAIRRPPASPSPAPI